MKFSLFLIIVFFYIHPAISQEFEWSPNEKIATQNAQLLKAQLYNFEAGMFIWIDPQLNEIRSRSFNMTLKEWEEHPSIAHYNEKIIDSSFTSLDSGEAFFVWIENSKSSVMIAKFNHKKKLWCTSQLLAFSKKHFEKVKIAARGRKCAMVWQCNEGKNNQIEAAIFDTESQRWSYSTVLSPHSVNCTDPKLVIDDEGNIHTIWSQLNGSLTTICSSRFDADREIWTSPIMLSSSWSQFSFSSSQIACDHEGNVDVVWHCIEGKNNLGMIQLAHFEKEKKSWTLPKQLSLDQFNRSPLISSNSKGDIIVIWENILDGKFTLQAIRYHPENRKWGEVLSLESQREALSHVSIQKDGQRNFYLIGQMGNQIFMSKFDSLDRRWRKIDELNPSRNNVDVLNLMVDEIGNVILVIGKDGEIISKYGDYLLPPQQTIGRLYRSRFPTKSYFGIEMNWQASSSPNIIGYRIREGVNVITTTQQTSCTVKMPNDEKKTFSISTVNHKNRESLPVAVKIQ